MPSWLKVLLFKILLTPVVIVFGVIRGFIYMAVPLYDLWTDYKRYE